jgi:threonine/homoserine/homoserine lactone efflux protein
MRDAMIHRNVPKVTFSSLLTELGRSGTVLCGPPYLHIGWLALDGTAQPAAFRERLPRSNRPATLLLYAHRSAHLVNFAIVALLVTLVPGPAFIVVLSTALRRGFRAGLYANAGVLAGDAIYFFLAAVGLGSLLAASYWAFTIVKWSGVTYLIYLGLRSLFYPVSEIVDENRSARSERAAFVTAVTVQLANPKLLLFLVALVPQFIEIGPPITAQFAVLGATFMLSDAVVYFIIAMFAARARPLLTKPWAARTTSRVTGVAMLGAAVRIGTER